MNTNPNDFVIENDVPIESAVTGADSGDSAPVPPAAGSDASAAGERDDSMANAEAIDNFDDAAPYGRKNDGTPMKRRGRPPKDQAQRDRLNSATRAAPRAPKVEPIKQATPIVADYEGSARIAANTFFGVGQAIFGLDWAPDVAANEHQNVKQAFCDYFEAEQIGKIPPVLALVLTLGAYAAIRLDKPTVQSRMSKIFDAIKRIKFPWQKMV